MTGGCWLFVAFALANAVHAFVPYTSAPPRTRLSLTMTTTSLEFGDDEDYRGHGISSSELRRMSDARRRRLAGEQDAKKFLQGDELVLVRQQVLRLRDELESARHLGAEDRVAQLERAILTAQQVDAEFVYEVELERMHLASAQGRWNEAEQHRQAALQARSSLPQFNLDGLWVGKYGDHGFEMINVTYDGDVLIANKVTSAENVPDGEVTFKVDLSPGRKVMDPIELGPEAAEQWGTQYLSRFDGQGQVSAAGFANKQYMPGQLILVKEYFSFAWLPIAHQVFFGRPSPELTLKLLREHRSKQTLQHSTRDFLQRCWDETLHLEDDMEVEEGLFQSHHQDDYYDLEGCFD